MEGDAGTSQLNPTGTDAGEPEASVAVVRGRRRTSQPNQISRPRRPSLRCLRRRRTVRPRLAGGHRRRPGAGGRRRRRGRLPRAPRARPQRGHRAGRRGRLGAGEGVRRGDAGARRRRDDGEPVEDHRMRDGRLRRPGQPVQPDAGRRLSGRPTWPSRCPTYARPSRSTTTTGRSTSWSRSGSR